MEKCYACRFYEESEGSDKFEDGEGRCRRNPPQIIWGFYPSPHGASPEGDFGLIVNDLGGEAALKKNPLWGSWPEVWGDSWCGEFLKRE
jgi:hypothetical protein